MAQVHAFLQKGAFMRGINVITGKIVEACGVSLVMQPEVTGIHM